MSDSIHKITIDLTSSYMREHHASAIFGILWNRWANFKWNSNEEIIYAEIDDHRSVQVDQCIEELNRFINDNDIPVTVTYKKPEPQPVCTIGTAPKNRWFKDNKGNFIQIPRYSTLHMKPLFIQLYSEPTANGESSVDKFSIYTISCFSETELYLLTEEDKNLLISIINKQMEVTVE